MSRLTQWLWRSAGWKATTLGLCSLLAVLPAFMAAAAGERGAGGAPATEPGIAISGSGGPQAEKSRIDTYVIEAFEGMLFKIDNRHEWPQGPPVSPYTFRLSATIASGIQITNIGVAFTGSGNCVAQATSDVTCNGDITSLTITYDSAKRGQINPPLIRTVFGGTDDAPIDYTLIVSYPALLTFASATPPPATHDPVQRRLTWTQADTTRFGPELFFNDPRRAWFPSLDK